MEEGFLSILSGFICYNLVKFVRFLSNIVFGKDVIYEYRLGYLRLKNFSKLFKS